MTKTVANAQIRSTHSESGFTLGEFAIVLIILGVMIGGMAATMIPVVKHARLTATRANMTHITHVLSTYAQLNNRIPCPADPDQSVTTQPYGFERGSGTNGNGLGSCNATSADAEGIVPFHTLGLKEQEIMDGWGRYITYRVSPVFTQDPADDTFGAHERCRLDWTWVHEKSPRNALKARFCCPDVATNAASTDIVIRDENNDLLWPFLRDGTLLHYDDVDVPFTGTPTFLSTSENVTAPAFALISHGPNGFGAFLTDGTQPTAGSGSSDEQENSDLDETIIVRKDRGEDFDDVVLWRNQDQLYSETGGATCIKP